MARIIDYNRGVLINSHPTLGMDVFMYVDTPGVYLTAHGTAVSEELAHQAGYPVEQYRKERQKRDRMNAAKVAIEKELEVAVEDKVLKERDGFKVMNLGLGRYDVVDPDGNVLHPGQHLPEATALKLLDQMAPLPVPKAPPPAQKVVVPLKKPSTDV